ncbi:hypothetical protein DTO166G4_9163 [Paecilomyces variotii]|nr:hypothetical protein DTO166G4_9163 [Paecilomyces variotii]KAJ9228201.1 hypothetical protein DTO166G5_8751 [Paecilomyces variotii]KAJ9238337.1 hypothetical protein DTO169E5_4881 [Paecilomyces variotii]KAJ9271850.1 hypothetical protein DTO212C5_1931 [Paecilomyces variotii]KAJ9319685.1 hypothetical protein DTO271D3_454 [Paecilomyces variotii]
MNQTQPYMDVHSSHLSSAQPYASQGATAGSLTHYQPYQQPPVLHPGSTTYAPTGSYSHYGYANGVTSPQAASQPSTTSMTSQVPAQLLPLPAMSNHSVSPHAYVTNSNTASQPYAFDTTGQIAPPGAKPRVTATLWEDEGSLCYQVEAKGVCVARREDNHMINGTKLLNVAGMTRGRRDGILKSEKIRHVVKIGPMHLKGVWIPFERALDFANKEKITDLLYPLFVHNIGGLLYHPTNQTRTNMVVHESQQRRLEGTQPPGTSQASQQPPTLHHHHSMQTPVPSQMAQPSNALVHPSSRPGLDRAHTFPTPPTSASSMMGMPSHGNSYEWGSQNVQGSQPLSIDTGLSNARSMPTTPATTPPGNNMQSMQSYQSQSGYDSSKPYYSAAPQSQAQYAPQQSSMPSYGQTLPPASYIKNEMAPPPGRGVGGQSETDQGDVKPDRYVQGNGHVGHGAGEAETVQEHGTEYLQDGSAAYNTNRGSYTYTGNPSVAALTADHSHISPDMTASPSHQNGADRLTPRTGGSQPQWAPGYNTPPRAPANSLYNIVSDTRGTAPNGDAYSTTNSAPSYSALNGSLSSNKRLRDDDDDRLIRPDSRGPEYEQKRRKTITETTIGGPVGGGPLGLQPMTAASVIGRRR